MLYSRSLFVIHFKYRLEVLLFFWSQSFTSPGSKFSSVAQSCSILCDPPWTTARQASLSITNFQSLLKLMSIKSMMPFNQFILCHPLLLLSIFPSIRVFSIESVLHIRWPKHWSFSFSISPPNEYSGLISFRIDWFDLLCPRQQREVLTQYCPGTWARGSSPGLRV